jgi:F0F1-type ATP synthase epsilon subunit
MTPAETEHFAALRMHVAHLHAALKVAKTYLDGGPVDVVPRDAQNAVDGALAESEASVAELLQEADRDNALVQARAERDAAIEATAAIGRRCTAIGSASRHLVAVYRQQDAGSEDWAGAMTAAVEELAQVLTA